MGIRSQLRNLFGRSRTAAKDGSEATVPEARTATEPSTAAPTARANTETSATEAQEAAEADAQAEVTASAPEPAKQSVPADRHRDGASTTTETDSLLAAFDTSAARPATEPVTGQTAGQDAEQNVEEAIEPVTEPAAGTTPVVPSQSAAPAADSLAGDSSADEPVHEAEAGEKAEADQAIDTASATGGGSSPSLPGQSAISLTKVEATAPGLVSLYKDAASALDAQRLAGQRAAVYLVLDRSGSMRRYYKDGTVQHLAEQALALSAHLDDDGTVPVVFFSTDIDGTADVSLESYEGRVDTLHAELGHMGRTNYHLAIEAVSEHYRKSGATDPAFVIFQTDGAPTSKAAAEKALCDAAELPIFWQFIGFGDPEAKGFDFLRKLDTLAVPDKRVVDNAGFFHAGLEPRDVSDSELYDKLTSAFPAWLSAAGKANLLP